MQLKPWVSPCVLSGWCSSPWKLWRVWLFDNVVLPMKLQTLAGPSVLTLALSLVSLCSVRWLAASILNCICMVLAERLRRHPYLVPIRKHFMALAIVLGFGGCIWVGSPGEAVSARSFLQSLLLYLTLYFLLWVFCSTFQEELRYPHSGLPSFWAS